MDLKNPTDIELLAAAREAYSRLKEYLVRHMEDPDTSVRLRLAMEASVMQMTGCTNPVEAWKQFEEAEANLRCRHERVVMPVGVTATGIRVAICPDCGANVASIVTKGKMGGRGVREAMSKPGPAALAARRLTSRGFRVYAEFKDNDGNTVRVQQSSADPLDRVRIYTHNAEGAEVMYFPANNTGWQKAPEILPGQPGYMAVTPHLAPDQCRELIRALAQHLEEVEGR